MNRSWVWVLAVLLCVHGVVAATLYVDGECGVNGDGSALSCASSPGGPGAFSDPQSGLNALAGGGDILNIRGAHGSFDGRYHIVVDLELETSGSCSGACATQWTPNNPGQIIIQGYNGEIPIIDGLVDRKDWTETSPGSGVWSRVTEERLRGQYCYTGGGSTTKHPVSVFEKVPGGDYIPLLPELTACTSIADGWACVNMSTDTLYINPTGTVDPNTGPNLYAAPDTDCLYSQKHGTDYITLKDIHFRGSRRHGLNFIGGSGRSNGIYLNNVKISRTNKYMLYSSTTTDVTAEDLTCEWTGVGQLRNMGGAFCLRVWLGERWTLRNWTHRWGGHGQAHMPPPWDNIGFAASSGNKFLRLPEPGNPSRTSDILIEGVRFENTLGGISFQGTPNVTVRGGFVKNAGGFSTQAMNDIPLYEVEITGVRFEDSGAASVRFQGHCADGGNNADACQTDADCPGQVCLSAIDPSQGSFGARVHNNEFVDVYQSSSVGNFRIQGSGRIDVYENTFSGTRRGRYPGNDDSLITVVGTTPNVNIKNNIFTKSLAYNRAQGLTVDAVAAQSPGLAIDNNLYWDFAGHPVNFKGIQYLTAAEFCADTANNPQGFECNAVDADPLLTNDLHLQTGSPAIDAGAPLSAVFGTDFDADTRPQGAGWDIGVDEFGGGGPSCHWADSDCNGDISISELVTVVLDWQAGSRSISELVEVVLLWQA